MKYQLPAKPPQMSAGSLSSMIDIVFLLIIFFVVTSSFDREQIDSAVMLPTISSAAIKNLPTDRLMINVLVDGSVKCGFHHLSASAVPHKLGNVLQTMKAGPKTVLIINGDRNVPHKYIAAVLNIAAKSGYGQARINAEIKKERE